VDIDAQAGGELLGLALPVEEQGARHHDQVRRAIGVLLAERLKEGEGDDRFAHAHIVGEAAAEAVAMEEVEPIEGGLLIWAQGAGEASGQGLRLDIIEVAQSVAAGLKLRVGLSAVGLGEGLVDQADVVLR
jgi:hypothetical protein